MLSPYVQYMKLHHDTPVIHQCTETVPIQLNITFLFTCQMIQIWYRFVVQICFILNLVEVNASDPDIGLSVADIL